MREFNRNNIHVTNKGLWSEKSFLRFDLQNSGSSNINNAGNVGIEVIDVDTFVNSVNTGIDLIKLDIEGAERQAINGSKTTIAFYQPDLQICVYHRPEDLWDIILQIYEINPYYKFYLGHHSRSLIETVLYATMR